MKIYTKRGDQGETSLYGGRRVLKTDDRIEAYGTVDELNSVLGLALSFRPSERTEEIVHHLQDELFVLGADLATPLDKKEKIDRIGESHISKLETTIDALEETLEPMRFFIHPGGTSAASTLHIARTVCRRAERACISCLQTTAISPDTIRYLNRLSDLLFVLARYENSQAGIPEEKWKVG